MSSEIRTFHVLPIDHEILGLEWRSWEDNDYFCTPKDAEIIGGPEVDGIHFVMVPNDKRVFCVNPVGTKTTYVLPVAATFLDFISYLLYCRESLPIARIHETTEKAFRSMLAEEAALTWPGSEVYYKKKKKSLRTLAAAYGVQAADPFREVLALQESFQMDEIVFTEEYEKVLAAGLEKGVFERE